LAGPLIGGALVEWLSFQKMLFLFAGVKTLAAPLTSGVLIIDQTFSHTTLGINLAFLPVAATNYWILNNKKS